MKQIRNSVFETNSSSTHSVTIYYNYNRYDSVEADGDIYLSPNDVYSMMRQNLQDFKLEEIQELLNAKLNESTNQN